MNQASEWCRDHLPDTLAEALSAFDQMVDVLVIPRIELSVHCSSLDEVTWLVAQQMEATIARLVVSGSTSPKSLAEPSLLGALLSEASEDVARLRSDQAVLRAVSYTHLTLPTKA